MRHIEVLNKELGLPPTSPFIARLNLHHANILNRLICFAVVFSASMQRHKHNGAESETSLSFHGPLWSHGLAARHRYIQQGPSLDGLASELEVVFHDSICKSPFPQLGSKRSSRIAVSAVRK